MVKNRKSNLALLLGLCLTCLVLCASYVPPAEAAYLRLTGSGGGRAETPAETAAPLPDGPPAEERPDNAADVYINGVLRGECLLIENRAYMSMESFGELMGLEYSNGALNGLKPELAESGNWAVLRGRYLWLGSGLQEQEGETLWPLSVLGRMFSCNVTWDPVTGSVDVDATELAELKSGDGYYDEEDLYWLSRIIFAESGNQSMEGMIAVGNVILNRVESALFPDTVYDVIFDTRYGVQFSPVETGGIYCEPDEEAVIAAKLCLDGANTAGGSLYFVNPDIGADGWFQQTKTFVASLGDHDFYA